MQDPSPPVESLSGDLLTAGRTAYDQRDWTAAFDLLSRADAAAPLGAAELELLAEAAFFAAQADRRLEIMERAVAAHLAEGDPIRSANAALGLAYQLTIRGRHSLASGWTSRAERLLDGQGESYPHAFLKIMRGEEAWARGDRDAAVALATDAVGIATRTGHRDLHAMAMASLAMFRIAMGDAHGGIALLEEAALA
ncbi:MAG: hypothetical protein WEC14_09170, partial [Chloroflexota bacterium]